MSRHLVVSSRQPFSSVCLLLFVCLGLISTKSILGLVLWVGVVRLMTKKLQEKCNMQMTLFNDDCQNHVKYSVCVCVCGAQLGVCLLNESVNEAINYEIIQ